MKMTRLHTDENGHSRFSEYELPLRSNHGEDDLSVLLTVSGAIFSSTRPGYAWDWINAPRAQLVVTISGCVEIELRTAEKRVFSPGEIFFAEDTEGSGHRTRVVGSAPWTCVYLPGAFPIEALHALAR